MGGDSPGGGRVDCISSYSDRRRRDRLTETDRHRVNEKERLDKTGGTQKYFYRFLDSEDVDKFQSFCR